MFKIMKPFRGQVAQEGDLWVAHTEKPKPSPLVWVKRFYSREKVVTLSDGRRARITVDESGTVKHREMDDTLDCKVLASPIILKLRRQR